MSTLKIAILVTSILALVTFDSKQEKSEKEAQGLKVGETAPVFKALDADNNLFHIRRCVN